MAASVRSGLLFVNSHIGRPGNIGLRTPHVLAALARRGIATTTWARGRHPGAAPGHTVHGMGLLGHLPRILNGVRIYLLPSYPHRVHDLRLFSWFCARGLRAAGARGPGTVAHVWDSCPALIRSLQQRGIPVVLDVPIAPGTYAQRLGAERTGCPLVAVPSVVALELEAMALADRLVAPSEFVAEELRRAGVDAGKIRVVEFGSPAPRPAPPRAPRPEGRVDFCFLGTVNRRKGIPELLTAWNDPAFQTDRLHLCGRVFPDIRPALAAARGGQVLTPGFVDSGGYLPDCDVFVFPTWLEGSAKAVYEAMAAGLPVITTPAAGSVVRDGVDGFLVPVGDAAALRERMRQLRADPGLRRRLGESARERAGVFTWERYGERVADAYDGLGA